MAICSGEISLDANSYLNKMENSYEGDFDQMEVAAGLMMRQIIFCW